MLPLIARVVVAFSWAVFAWFFLIGRRPKGEKEIKRAPASRLGIALQSFGIALAWGLQRDLSPPGPRSAAGTLLLVVAPILSIASVAFGLWAVRTLGRQWSYTARLVEGHRLVTEGPYRIVRHPIYTAMLGKLLATNFAYGHWIGLLAALPVFLAGTLIRVRAEERLLREAMPSEYEAYARRVPAFIPFLV